MSLQQEHCEIGDDESTTLSSLASPVKAAKAAVKVPKAAAQKNFGKSSGRDDTLAPHHVLLRLHINWHRRKRKLQG